MEAAGQSLAAFGFEPVTEPAPCADMTRLALQLWDIGDRICDFPQNNPQTLRLSDAARLEEAPHEAWVGEKTDGSRAFLLLGNSESTHECFSVWADRAGRFFGAPCAGRGALFQGTLVDGELVHTPSGPLWLVFDIVALAGEYVAARPFSARLAALRELLGAYEFDPPVECRLKQFVPLTRALELARALRAEPARGGYGTDGLIVVAEGAPLRPGRGQGCLKWRAEHTVDLQALGAHELGVDHKGEAVRPRGIALRCEAELRAGAVYECRVREERAGEGPVGHCEVVRERRDKARANPEYVLWDTLETQREGTGWDWMLAFLARCAPLAPRPEPPAKRPRE